MLSSKSSQIITLNNILNIRYNEPYQSYRWLFVNNELTLPAINEDNIHYNTPQTIYCMTSDNNTYMREESIFVFRSDLMSTLKLIITQNSGI